MHLRVKLKFLGAILVHPVRRQNFAGTGAPYILQHLRLCHTLNILNVFFSEHSFDKIFGCPPECYEATVEGCSNGETNIFPEFLLLVKDRRFWQQSYLTYVSLEYK